MFGHVDIEIFWQEIGSSFYVASDPGFFRWRKGSWSAHASKFQQIQWTIRKPHKNDQNSARR